MCSETSGVGPRSGSASSRPACWPWSGLGAGITYAVTAPRLADQVTNIDVLRQQIRNYYGDPLGSGIAADDSNYANEARSVADAGLRWLDATHNTNLIKAIVLDVDDTTLLTWNYEVFSNWAFNPTTNGQFVTELGYDIVANFGDQFSDLEGGHADRTFKMPNPNYFLP
jgi:HAD superfamily, subfamily IIIB (Acid phosphatase)